MRGISLFVGLPVSVLSFLISEFDMRSGDTKHLVAAPEGNKVAIAMGHYLATTEPLHG